MIETRFYFSAWLVPCNTGSVSQAQQQFMLPIRILCLLTDSYMSFHKSVVPLVSIISKESHESDALRATVYYIYRSLVVCVAEFILESLLHVCYYNFFLY